MRVYFFGNNFNPLQPEPKQYLTPEKFPCRVVTTL